MWFPGVMGLSTALLAGVSSATEIIAAVPDATLPILAPSGQHLAWAELHEGRARVCIADLANAQHCQVHSDYNSAPAIAWLSSGTLAIGGPQGWEGLSPDGTTSLLGIHGGLIWRNHFDPLFWQGSSVGGQLATYDEANGRMLPVSEGPPGAGWPVIADGRVAGRIHQNDSGQWIRGYLAQPLYKCTAHRGAECRIWPTSFDSSVLVTDENRLLSVRLDSGESRLLATAEVGVFTDIFQDQTGKPIAVAERFARKTWKVLDPAWTARFVWLSAVLADADIDILGTSVDGDTFLVRTQSGLSAGAVYVANFQGRQLVRTRPLFGAFEAEKWQPMTAFVVDSIDGIKIPAYLTLPDSTIFGLGPYATIVDIHGGPWSDGREYGFNAFHQTYARDGYAVLSVDYRGSRGYGREFSDASAHEFADGMVADVVEGINAGVKYGVDPSRVGIFGVSYGGFSALSILTRFPTAARCAVVVGGFGEVRGMFFSGISRSLLGPGRERRQWEPIAHVQNMSGALLLVHGEGDHQVPVRLMRRFALAAKQADRLVTAVTLKDEPHDFDALTDRSTLVPLASAFFRRCLTDEKVPPVEISTPHQVVADELGLLKQ